jgi:hydroxymethylpyrimidine/phosphomethylpyrimidine kinase
MTVLTIAGFDPSGGAGILSDVKTFHALGEYGTAVITALTAQNVKRVEGILPVDVDFIEKQIDTVLEGEGIVHAKTGMLYSPEIIKAVAGKVEEYGLKVVVDPVMIAGSGGLLSKEDVVHSLKRDLLPLAELATPNIYEAQAFAGIKIIDEGDAIEAAYKIGELCNVVVTGGHLEGNDVLYDGSIKVIEGELIESENVHGSGCTYSAACTVYLQKGYKVKEAVQKAGVFTKKSIKHGLKGTLNQFWSIE